MNNFADVWKQTQFKPNTKPIQSQNKPNSQKAKMNVSSFLTKDYENETAFRLRQNKPNTNPIKPNSSDPDTAEAQLVLQQASPSQRHKTIWTEQVPGIDVN